MENLNNNYQHLLSELKKYKDIVDMLTNTVLGGVAKMSAVDMRLISASEGYYRMTGYTQEESLQPPFSNCGLNLVYPEDMKIIEDALQTLVVYKKPIHIEYRIIKKDGTLVWNSAICTGMQEDEQEKYIEVFFQDITKEKEQHRINVLNEERFRIISEQTNDVVFEWNIKTDELSYSSVYEDVYGSKPARNTKELFEINIFFEEDKPIVADAIEQLRNGRPNIEFKVRLRLADGTYFWALHRVTLIYDENHQPSHVVGIVSNVNDFVENAIELQHRAEHDSLTGLYNRSVAQRFIEEIISESDCCEKHAFIQFDIDRFKQINDFMGHAAGDVALQGIADLTRKHFSENIIARMGGDEFVVFIKNYRSIKELEYQLNKFIREVYSDFKYEEKIYPFSISIGVSLYPKDSTCYQELYENADIALYRAKRKGGNCIEYFK